MSRLEAGTADGRESALVAALIELLAASPAAMAQLVELLEHQRPAQQLALPAYTVASLAAALGVSPRVVRGAIARGELAAVKRGGRWIISPDAVRVWAQQDGTARRVAVRRSVARRDRPLGSAVASLAGANAAQRSL
jgi:excisionase family DNA binding protein